MIAVLHTEGVEAFADRRRRERARLRVMWLRVSDVVVPAAVLAEGVLTGNPAHDVQVHRLLGEATVASVSEAVGLKSGALRHQAQQGGASPSGVDAIVAAVADDCAERDEVVIVTSDEDDLLALARFADHAGRLSIERV